MRCVSEENGPHSGEPPSRSGSRDEGHAPPRLLLTVNEAAERLTISRTEMCRMIRRGFVPVVKIGRLTRIRPEALQAVIDRLEAAS